MRMNPASSSFRSDLAGVWRRLQVLPDDEAGATVSAQRPTVVRLQAGPWFAQWMQEPAERAVPAVPLCDLAPMQLAALTEQQACWGVCHLDAHPEGEVAHWLPRVDFQPPNLQSDAGWLLFDQPERCIEIDTHSDRSQVWVREPGTAWRADEVWCLQGLDADGHDDGRVLLGAGPWRVYLRPRRGRWPRGLQPGLTLHDLLLHQPDDALSWLDHELSLGRCEGTRCDIVLSSLPASRGGQRHTTIAWHDDGQRAWVRWGDDEGWWRPLPASLP